MLDQTQAASARHRVDRRGSHGFTLVELLTVVAIIGIMAALALTGYTKNVRSARRTEVVGDLSAIALRQNALMSARGHFASTSNNENDTFPVTPAQLAAESEPIRWDITQEGYTRDAVAPNTQFFRAGGLEHGFDVLGFLPEGSVSWCTYGTISGDGTTGQFGDEPPAFPLGAEVFPNTDVQLERFYARDWFYAFAKCDFDRDGTYWDFTTAHFQTDVNMGNENYGE